MPVGCDDFVLPNRRVDNKLNAAAGSVVVTVEPVEKGEDSWNNRGNADAVLTDLIFEDPISGTVVHLEPIVIPSVVVGWFGG